MGLLIGRFQDPEIVRYLTIFVGRLKVSFKTFIMFCKLFGKFVGKAPSIADGAGEVSLVTMPRLIN